MEYVAFTKSSQVSPRKVRLVADLIRRKSIDEALSTLSFLKKRGASPLEKTIRSAIANAISRNAARSALFIKNVEIMGGPAYKRYHFSTRGRTHPYKKRTSHVRIILSDEVNSSLKMKNIAKTLIQTSKKEKEEQNGTKD